MQLEFDVSDEQILEAEQLLLPPNATFGEEARNFIRNWSDVDLQAVPGSGKTTVLLAKLLVLDRHLERNPSTNGVLVISHTNTAVNEIRDRIGFACRHVFKHPNFVGTIQSFVDTFLAKPYFVTKYGEKISRIDDDAYYASHTIPQGKVRGWIDKNQHVFFGSRLADDGSLVQGFPTESINLSKETSSYKAIEAVKQELRNRGILSYDEAYLLAFDYLAKYPEVASLIRDRFKYVFIDEVQDMNTAQYSILEKLFYLPNSTRNVYQRIGDQNQAIYSNTDGSNQNWKDRALVLRLETSQRLSPKTAKVVQPFGLCPIEVVGERVSEEAVTNIKPMLLVYDNDTIENVIPKFSQIIQEKQQSGEIEGEKQSHVAIGWTTESNQEKGHIKLDAYYSDFQKTNKIQKFSGDNLEAAVLNAIANTDKTGRKFKKDVNEIYLQILKLEGVKNKNDRHFNSISLHKYLKEMDTDINELYKEHISELIFLLAKAQKDAAMDSVKAFADTLLSWFDKKISSSKSFLDSPYQGEPFEISSIKQKRNVYQGENNIEIKVCTVHSVKGQTHTSVLYVDTFYYQYESQKLPEQILGQPFSATNKARKVQATKMMYVGFSRPTHLLCYAVHKENYDSNLKDKGLADWEVVIV